MSGLIDRLLRRRNKFPPFVNRTIDYIADNPTGLVGRLATSLNGRADSRVSHPVSVPADLPTRVLIAPVNYSGQGHGWAKSLEKSDPMISARTMAVNVPGGFSFAADLVVRVAVYHNGARWQQEQFRAVADGFTHVLVEAEEPLFGRLFGRDVGREVAALEAAGISVAFLCHGTDVRLPSRHRESSQWSPYLDTDLYTDRLEQLARRNIALVEGSGRPVFVSTPDLLLDVPSAEWCPVVVDPSAWALPHVERSGPLRVVHVPSSTTMKGSALIKPTLALLHDEGVIDYRSISGVPSDQMRAVYESADVVLDQFRLGSYGVTACEAMAAGRMVVGHVNSAVREAVRLAAGEELPVVEADPGTLETVLREIAADQGVLAAARATGLKFVSHVHDGTMSASILRSRWIDIPARTVA